MAKNSELKLTLKKAVTMGALKTLDKYGLTARPDRNDMTMTQSIYEICLNENYLREVCEAIYEDDFSSMAFESLDLREVIGGYKSFLQNFFSAMKN